MGTAILAIIDGGRASEREWKPCEKAYIEMFTDKSLEVELTVLRIRVVKSSKKIEFEIVPNPL